MREYHNMLESPAISVVDDDADLRDLLEELLKKNGYGVITAQTLRNWTKSSRIMTSDCCCLT